MPIGRQFVPLFTEQAVKTYVDGEIAGVSGGGGGGGGNAFGNIVVRSIPVGADQAQTI